MATELLLAVYAALWPIVLNTAGGVAAVHPRQYDVARVLHLSRLGPPCARSSFPRCSRHWLIGARLAAVIGLLVAIVAEMIMYPRGLGGGLIESLNALAPARMWAYALVCGAIGLPAQRCPAPNCWRRPCSASPANVPIVMWRSRWRRR